GRRSIASMATRTCRSRRSAPFGRSTIGQPQQHSDLAARSRYAQKASRHADARAPETKWYLGSHADGRELGLDAFLRDCHAAGEQSLDMQANRHARPLQAFFHRLALSNDPGQGWHRDRVAAFVIVWIETDRVAPFACH